MSCQVFFIDEQGLSSRPSKNLYVKEKSVYLIENVGVSVKAIKEFKEIKKRIDEWEKKTGRKVVALRLKDYRVGIELELEL